MNEIMLLILEKVCEAIYFSMFLMTGKDIKERKFLFTAVMIFEYLMITSLIEFSIWIHILYIAMSYINLKVFYKEKAQITDIFLFMAASLILIIISMISYGIVYITIREYNVALILNRILLFGLLFLFRKNINKIYKKFYTLWNRHSKPNKIKSLTLRNISVIIFNLMFFGINLGMGMLYIVGER